MLVGHLTRTFSQLQNLGAWLLVVNKSMNFLPSTVCTPQITVYTLFRQIN